MCAFTLIFLSWLFIDCWVCKLLWAFNCFPLDWFNRMQLTQHKKSLTNNTYCQCHAHPICTFIHLQISLLCKSKLQWVESRIVCDRESLGPIRVCVYVLRIHLFMWFQLVFLDLSIHRRFSLISLCRTKWRRVNWIEVYERERERGVQN